MPHASLKLLDGQVLIEAFSFHLLPSLAEKREHSSSPQAWNRAVCPDLTEAVRCDFASDDRCAPKPESWTREHVLKVHQSLRQSQELDGC